MKSYFVSYHAQTDTQSGFGNIHINVDKYFNVREIETLIRNKTAAKNIVIISFQEVSEEQLPDESKMNTTED